MLLYLRADIFGLQSTESEFGMVSFSKNVWIGRELVLGKIVYMTSEKEGDKMKVNKGVKCLKGETIFEFNGSN